MDQGQDPRVRVVAAMVGVIGVVASLCLVVASPSPAVSAPASTSPASTASPTALADPPAAVTSIAAGGSNGCVVSLGAVSCWGSNGYGQLGDGTRKHSAVPVPVATAGTPLAGATVTQVAVGDDLACALTSAGSVACWGGDGSSRVGSATQTTSLLPVAIDTSGVLAGKTVTQISTKRRHVCVLTSDGTVACWGSNTDGQLGDGTTTSRNTPVAVATAGTPLAGKVIASIDVGDSNTCSVATDGTLGCWGRGTTGQLGNGAGDTSTKPVSPRTSGTALEGKVPVQVTVGSQHVCARSTDGSVACWGSGGQGALGRGSIASSTVPVPVTVAGTALEGETVTGIDAGDGFTCVRFVSGGLACWGTNTSGELGIGTTATRALVAADVPTVGTPFEGRPLTALATGGLHSCAAAGDVVACWGANRYGGIGAGVSGISTVPAAPVAGVLAGASVAEIEGGKTNGCARTAAGAVACWGDGSASQNGVPGVDDALAPVWVATGSSPLATSPAIDLAVGTTHACAASADGSLTCWGGNDTGQLGRPGLPGPVPAAVTTAGSALAGRAVVEVVAGTGVTCARTADGKVACWGVNSRGQLGTRTGTATSTNVPTALATAGTVLDGKTITDLAYSTDTGCVLASDSTLACWGENRLGAVGNGSMTSWFWEPQAVTTAGTPLAGKAIVAIEAGESDTMCAVASDATVACWGQNAEGAIGNGTVENALIPVAPTKVGTPLEGRTVAQASPGERHTCIRATDSTLTCSGYGFEGSLGNGADAQDRLVPTAVATAGTPLDGQAIKQIASLGYATCALTTSSVISCWGPNWHGELGNGTPSLERSPQAVTGFGPAATVPGPPVIGTVTPGNGQVEVTWAPPASDGGSAITGYLVTPSIGGVAQAPVASAGTGTSKVVSGLTNGTAHTFTVSAVNALGTGAASAASGAVTPRAPYTPFGSWGALVDRVFVDLTAAAPTSSQRSSWVAQLAAGTKSKGDLVAALRLTTDNTSRVDPTVRLYRALLGRAPDAGGLKFWINRRRSGVWTLNKMATSFSSSAEFKRKYGSLSNRAFVTQIYTDVLGRVADPGGVAYWTGKLDSGQRTRGTVMVGFSESNEYRRKQAENTDVAVAHIFLLGRVPTPAEASAWTARQKAGASVAVLAGELLDSAGYAAHIAGS